MFSKISKLLKNEKMADAPTNAKNNKMQKLVEVKAFYNKHFPTDRRTYNLRIPFVGLILSIFVLHFVTTCFAVRNYFRYEGNNLAKYCYVFIAASLGYELYYGLKIGDRKQFTPWILLKFIEICLTFATIIYIFVDERSHLWYYVGEIIYGFVLLGFNILVTYIVTSTSVKQFRGYAPKTNANNVGDENVYDTYDDV